MGEVTERERSQLMMMQHVAEISKSQKGALIEIFHI
jgi:hypothetical protein